MNPYSIAKRLIRRFLSISQVQPSTITAGLPYSDVRLRRRASHVTGDKLAGKAARYMQLEVDMAFVLL